jgi:YVTN family beta-propeller protein
VGFYSAAGQRLAGVPVSVHPHEIVLSHDRRSLYVSDNGILWMTDPGEGDNTISILDIARRAKTGEISLGRFRRPHGMDVDHKTGRLLVTVENPSGLLLVDPAARRVLRSYDVQGTMPHMVVLSSDAQWAYVSNSGSGTIAVVHLDSGKVKLIPTDARPQGGVRSADGRLIYITNSDGHSISILDAARQERIGVIPVGKQPGRMALTPDGKTLVYNLQGDNAIGFADVAARRQTAVVPIGGRSLSLTLSPDGKLAYGGIQDQDRIAVVSVPERKLLRYIQTPKGAGPDPAVPLP